MEDNLKKSFVAMKENLLLAEQQTDFLLFNLSLESLKSQIDLVLKQVRSQRNHYGRYLPLYLNLHIKSFLESKERANCQLVCHDWLTVQQSDCRHNFFGTKELLYVTLIFNTEMEIDDTNDSVSIYKDYFFFQRNFYNLFGEKQERTPRVIDDQFRSNGTQICSY